MTDPDPIWPVFRGLWPDLRQADPRLLVAGGYGLFLKQAWLAETGAVPIVVPLDRWLDPTPRATKDIDLVVSLDLLASAEANRDMSVALARHGFTVAQENWQFENVSAADQTILVDLHALPPPPSHAGLTTTRKPNRVKHKPSLGTTGVHGRENPEAVGHAIHPFRFDREGVSIAVPNPVTWAMMKLTAMQDRFARTTEAGRTEQSQISERIQGAKHAQDVCRAVAMVTPEERDRADEVLSALRGNPAHEAGRRIFADTFATDQGEGVLNVSDRWNAGDLSVIRAVLGTWFG